MFKDNYIIRLFVIMVFILSCNSLSAQDAAKINAQDIVNRAEKSFTEFVQAKNMDAFRANLKNAKGVFILHSSKIGFIIGGSGGTGVVLLRDEKSGSWSSPAFFSVGALSIGALAGVDVSDEVMLLMTDKGVQAFLQSKFKLGGAASVAAGPVGSGTAGTVNSDIIVYGRSKGAFIGISLDGAKVDFNADLNADYYGAAATPAEIMVEQKVSNGRATPLRSTVNKAAGG